MSNAGARQQGSAGTNDSDASSIERLDYGGGEIRMHVRTPAERKRLKSCAKEPWTVDWIERWLQPGEVLFDIGANVGAYSLVAARANRGRVHVVAFEPAFPTYASLCRNIALNDMGGAVRPMPIGLGAVTRLETMHLRTTEAGAALHAQVATLPGEGYEQTLIVFALDDFVAQFAVASPNHIKLDVDGPELDVLDGARETLRRPALRSLLVEMDTGMEESIRAKLEGWGFTMSERFQRERPGPEKPPAYGLFLPGSQCS